MDTVQLTALAGTALVVMVALVAIWRPLNFASMDPELAEARGIPVRRLGIVFMVLLGISVALSIQVVGGAHCGSNGKNDAQDHYGHRR